MVKFFSRFRYLILTSTLLVILWSVLYWLNQTHESVGARDRVATIGRLLDADTTLMVHIPDVHQAHQSLAGSHFAQLGIHRGLGAITKQIIDEVPQLRQWRDYWKQFQEMEITDAAIAVTEQADRRHFLTLFYCEASRNPAWEPQAVWWHESSPEVPLEEIREERDGVEYIRVARDDCEFVYARWEGWHLSSNEPNVLDRALSRLKSGQHLHSLAQQTAFQQSVAPLRSDYLALAYAGQEGSKSGEKDSAGQHHAGKIQRLLNGLDARSMALSLNVQDGQMIEDTMIVAATLPDADVELPFPLAATLPLTSPRTLAYFTANTGADSFHQFIFRPYLKRWAASGNEELEKIAEIWETRFGPVWALQLEPIEILSSSQPMETEPLATLLAFAAKDPGALHSHLETLATTRGSGIRRSATGTFILDHALLPSSITNLLDEVHLHIEHGLLFVSDQVRGIHQVCRRWHLGQDLKQRPDFQKLLGRLPEPELGLGYLDAQQLLRRTSEALQHPLVFATLWMGIRSQTHLKIDLHRLTTSLDTEMLILPTLATWQRIPHGYRQWSQGTLSPAQWAWAGSTIVTTIDKTFLEPAPLTETDTFAAPPLEQELLRMMEP